MMYVVYVAVCLASMAPRDCDRATAVDWVAAPEPQPGLAECAIHGQEYAADSRLVHDGEYVKIYCVAPTSVGKSNIG
jgi:hypothetical protein